MVVIAMSVDKMVSRRIFVDFALQKLCDSGERSFSEVGMLGKAYFITAPTANGPRAIYVHLPVEGSRLRRLGGAYRNE